MKRKRREKEGNEDETEMNCIRLKRQTNLIKIYDISRGKKLIIFHQNEK